jgi:hypothetical protein
MSALSASIAQMAPTSAHHWIGRDTAQKREYAKRTSRYMPHQGEREMARRRKQMGKA